MILKLTDEEAQELRRALFAARAQLLRGLSDAIGCGYSARNMALCAQRACVERLLDRLDHAPEAVPISRPVNRRVLADAA